MSAALQILARAQDHGLPHEFVQEVRREFLPALDVFLAAAPPLPPVLGPAELELDRQFLGLIVAAKRVRVAWQSLLDAFARAVEDLRLRAEGTDESAAKRRDLANLADALDSVTRMNVAIEQHRPRLVADAEVYPEHIDDESRGFLRGIVATMIAVPHLDEDASRLAPWTWTARFELVKAEGLMLAQLARPDRGHPKREIPRRAPEAWKGVEIRDDFDAPCRAMSKSCSMASTIGIDRRGGEAGSTSAGGEP